MNCTVQKLTEKRLPAPSRLLVNPKAVLVLALNHEGKPDIGIDIKGDRQFPREQKSKWVFFLNDYSGGKKKTLNICTISFWDIVDDFIAAPTGMPYKRIQYFKTEDSFNCQQAISNGMKRHFTDVYATEVLKLEKIVKEKFDTIKAGVLEEFKTMGEYNLLVEYCKLLEFGRDHIDKKMRDERAQIRKEQKEAEDRRAKELRGAMFGNFGAGSSLSDEEKVLLKEAFNTLALKVHPDLGGDSAKMVQLNALRSKLLP